MQVSHPLSQRFSRSSVGGLNPVGIPEPEMYTASL